MRTEESDQPIALPREIRGLYFLSFGHGPMASILIIFIQLLIVKQTKYLASENSEGDNWIEWRQKFADGKLCNGTGRPYPKDDPQPYARPEGYPSDCVWFPSNKDLPIIGIEYTNAIVYGATIVLFLTGVLLLIVGPFSDYGRYRRRLLTACVVVWIPVFSSMFFVSDPDLYFIGLALTGIGSVAFGFGLRSPLASYLPLLINASHELTQLRQRVKSAEREHQAQTAVTIEMTRSHVDRTPVTEGTGLMQPATSNDSQNEIDGNLLWKASLGSSVNDKIDNSENSGSAGDLLIGTDDLVSNEDDLQQLKEAYQKRYEAVAGKTAIAESAFFIGGQLICLVVQFGLLVWLADEDDPKDTIGERSSILVATSWATIFCVLGLRRLKNREAPPFPPGNKFMIGAKRSIRTLKLLYDRLPRLLCLMIGRMLFWLSIQTILAMSTLFFEREFAMTATEVAPIVLIYLAVGVPSAVVTSLFIQRYSGHILRIFQVFCLLTMCLPVYMLIGVRERYEIYILMCLAALLVAPFPALVRAMMADMIPQGFIATIMSFEGLLENCTTWIGPLMVGGILDLTGSLRFSLFALEIFMIAGLPFVMYTHLQKGREQRLSVEIWSIQRTHLNQYKTGVQ